MSLITTSNKINISITIGYCDGAEFVIRYFQRIMNPILKNKFPQYNVEIQWVFNPPLNPDLLIHSIFSSHHKKYDCVKICYCGEPNNISHITEGNLLIDCKDVLALRHPQVSFLYLPFYIVSFFERVQHKPRDLIKPKDYPIEQIMKSKQKFCAFLYHHDVPFRNELFDFISKHYKTVDALGRCGGNSHYNNDTDRTKNSSKSTRKAPQKVMMTDRQTYDLTKATYNDLAVQKYVPYKFVICCENSLNSGYITEKIVNAMLAHAIPIYFGAPEVVRHFNVKSFVNVADFDSLNDLVLKIREIDENDELYLQYLSEPWLPNNEFTPYFQVDYARSALEKLFQP